MSLIEGPTLASIHRAFEIGRLPLEITGTTNDTFLAWVLAREEASPRPRLVICLNDKTARAFAHDLRAIKPDVTPVVLEAFDESPYSGLYPSKSALQSRTHFLWRALHARNDEVFVAGIEGLLQKTVPLDHFKNFQVTLKKGDDVDAALLLSQMVQCGYESAPLVEDPGTFSRRGDILDVFSPLHPKPFRIEFFGDQIEGIRLFDPETQRSEQDLDVAQIIPAREIFLTDDLVGVAKPAIKKFCDDHGIGKESREQLIEPLNQRVYAHGIDYWLASFYGADAATPLDAFKTSPAIYWLDSLEITRAADGFLQNYKMKFRDLIARRTAAPNPENLYVSFDDFVARTKGHSVQFTKIHVDDHSVPDENVSRVKAFDTSDLSTVVRAAREAKKDFFEPATAKIKEWRDDGLACFVWAGTQTQAQRIHYLFESHGLSPRTAATEEASWGPWFEEQRKNKDLLQIIPRYISNGGRFPEEGFVFVREEDLFGSRTHRETRRTKGTLEQRADLLSFGDLNPGDHVVHTLHGVGVYEGLKKLTVQNVDAEFIQLKYKDNDRLYLPVYRVAQIQEYSSPSGHPIIDKLGSTSWQKAKVKVRDNLKDLASDLLQLYAKRNSMAGFAFTPPDDDFREFEATFPYDETPDQAKAIDDVLSDMQKERPMDRLVCGDVGFGKTEVAIRAAYKAVEDKKQVAVLVPTTVLAFQHFQTFSKRLKDTAVKVAMVSRFQSTAQVRKDLADSAEGKVDILIGTHRLLSKDVVFKDLGLLIVDEEQKFGVGHKEKIKRLRSQVDVLSLSATPIPRTLNMALMGVRDLSIINTPPEDRLSIRTFISRFEAETIRKAILSEVSRGGQIFFIHNRVQSINHFAEELKQIVPEVRVRIGHGQMPEDELEKTMVDFYNHEFDLLLCTTIIESGLDIPSANTIVVDRADTFGLSQLYQLRGRVGRSKERAYCYLLIPPQGVVDKTAAERLKILQEHTDLGSGFMIAHHDLELRGGGNILGEDQSGQIAAVGYELYMDLLAQALAEAKGEPPQDEIEPEINLRIQALIPDSYIEDIRIRLSYYKMLSEISNESDLDRIESEFTDRFGPVPEPVTNLLGVMLIRKYCRDLGVRDISSGPKNLSLIFTSATKAAPDKVVRLTTNQPQKYQVTPDQRLIIRLNSTTWAPILEELKNLKRSLL